MIIEVAERGGKAFAARKEVFIDAQYLLYRLREEVVVLDIEKDREANSSGNA